MIVPYKWDTATPESQNLDGEKLDQLWDLVQYWKSRAGRQCTATALVVARHGELVYERYWGTLGTGIDTPVDQHSVFSIYSGNKTVTQVMIGHLIDEGFIGGLDDKLSQYLGADLGTHQWKDEITLDHLRLHHAGYDTESATSSYPWPWQAGRDHPLRFRPGTQFLYSSVGANTNAEVARRALPGYPRYHEALREHILAPLGMADTRFLFEGDDLSNVVRLVPGSEIALKALEGVEINGGVVDYMDPGGSNMGAGWLHCSARDYARFGLMLANGGEDILSKERLEEIYPPPINGVLITGRMECQCHVLWDLGLVMAIMVNSPAGPRPESGVWNQTEFRSALLKAVTDVPLVRERDGKVCMEAEHFAINWGDYKWGTGHVWQFVDDESASGGTAMAALPEDGVGSAGTELVYLVYFSASGQYRVWLRGRGGHTAQAVTVDLDGKKTPTARRVVLPKGEGQRYGWSQRCDDGSGATLTIPNPGVYSVQVLMEGAGPRLDKIYLTTGTETPRDVGPDESELA